ncbi:MAG: DUF5606 domain-containing protein [Bacteroidia bacterium]|nr:DUF5606 domain-containing protein [Bacteroidia bacterium]
MIDLHGIISISGLPGLYKVVAQSKNGVIVESLTDKKRFPAFASHKISSLEEISMFTSGEDKPLKEIMKAIFDKENGGPCIDHKKDDKEVIAYFESVLPDYDKERVYVSNMKKLFGWYNQLQSTGNLKMEEDKTVEEKEKTTKLKEAKNTNIAELKKREKTKGAKVQAGVTKTAGVRKAGLA